MSGTDGNGAPLRDLQGDQRPTHRLAPPYATTLGDTVREVVAITGDVPDEWHWDLWDTMLGRDAAGRPTVTTAELEVARRNAKTWPVHRLALARVLFGDPVPVVWTSYRADAALKAFAEMGAILDRSPSLRRQVTRTVQVNGQQAYQFRTGASISYRTRKASVSEASQGGRSLEAGLLVFDEDQDLNEEADSALLPLVATIPGAQRIYMGSAGHRGSTVKARLLRNAERGVDRLLCLRWSAGENDDLASEATWARHLPALNRPRPGRDLTSQTIADAFEHMPRSMFAREWMSVGDYPSEGRADWVIPEAAWVASTDPASAATGRLVWSVEVSHDQASAAIAVAGHRRDGDVHVEVVAHRPGHRWAAPELARLVAAHPTRGVAVNLRGPTGALRGALVDAGLYDRDGVSVVELSGDDTAEAYAQLLAAIRPGRRGGGAVRHRDPEVLRRALAAATAKTSPTGRTTWSIFGGEEDVSPLLAVTWALHGLVALSREKAVVVPRPVAVRAPGSAPGRGGRRDALTVAGF